MIDVVVFFFLLGVFARLVKSDLRLPEALYETLSIYLLLAIGLKGGVELSRQTLETLAPQVLACAALGFTIPLLLFPALRALRLQPADAASVAAHFGSVSVVTFAVATAALQRAGVAYETHAALWVAVMEAPGIVAGILLARWSMRAAQAQDAMARKGRWGELAHDVLFGKSVLLLLGGLAIGAVAGVAGTEPLRAVSPSASAGSAAGSSSCSSSFPRSRDAASSWIEVRPSNSFGTASKASRLERHRAALACWRNWTTSG